MELMSSVNWVQVKFWVIDITGPCIAFQDEGHAFSYKTVALKS